MKAIKLIQLIKRLCEQTKDTLGIEDILPAGPYSLTECKLPLDDEKTIQGLGLSDGIYIIANHDDDVLYVGVSDNSLIHRIWERLKAITLGEYKSIGVTVPDVSHGYVFGVKPQKFNHSIESIAIALSDPLLNKSK